MTVSSFCMAAFSDLDWSRFDVWACVAMEGVVAVDAAHRESCRAWLRRNWYGIDTLDFVRGIGPAVVALGERLHWVERFGYALSADRRNLDALRDGFDFDVKAGHGHVLELLHPDAAYKEDARWLCGLLSIAREHSRSQLALGDRFFTCLVVDPDSLLVGVQYESLSVPLPYRKSGRDADPFTS